MPTTSEWTAALSRGAHNATLSALYGPNNLPAQRQRYADAIARFEALYGAGRAVSLYSVPGRVELCGNHTDHQRGLVMAAAIHLDTIAVASPTDEPVIRLRSHGFDGEFRIKLAELAPVPGEAGGSTALIRGVAAAMAEAGGTLGGVDIYVTSDVWKGSGLSSSAAFSVCVGAVLNGEYNGERFGPVELARFAQRAENTFFQKPSGLMDQLACAVGGTLQIDFADPARPQLTPQPFHPAEFGLELMVCDTGGSHAQLTGAYAAIRHEMEQVAAHFGKDVLRQVEEAAFYDALPALRQALGERAILRSMHFFDECKRVAALAEALAEKDRQRVLALLVESGYSSYMLNQNAYDPAHPAEQPLALGLALARRTLAGSGAWRLQGGGFAGTVLALVPTAQRECYRQRMEAVFGAGACRHLHIRQVGACRVL